MKAETETVDGLIIALYVRGALPRKPSSYVYLGHAASQKIPRNSGLIEFISLTGDSTVNYFGKRASGSWVHYSKDEASGEFIAYTPYVEYIHDIVP